MMNALWEVKINVPEIAPEKELVVKLYRNHTTPILKNLE